MRSWTKPTAEQLKTARAHLGRVGAQRYFFDKLENPEWVEPLREAGVFDHPPPAERDEEKGTIAFPLWPESAYLVRMAPLKPQMVAEIACRIETDNMRIVQDLVEIALKVPAAFAVPIARIAGEKEWARSPFGILLPLKLANLAAHLAKGSEMKAAFRLAGALLQVRHRRKGPAPRADAEEQIELPADYMNSNDLWMYREAMKIILPALLAADGFEAFNFTSRLLRAAVSPRGDSKGNDGEDYSSTWRRAIEHTDQDTTMTFENTLVDAVRDAATTILSDGRTTIEKLVDAVERRELWIFRRMALHLLAEVRPAGHELAAARLLRRDLFDDARCRHEYARLLETRFDELTEVEQGQILDWITGGPNLQRAGENHQRVYGVAATEETLQKHKRFWVRDRLTWLGKNLPERLAPLLKTLVEELGEPEGPTFSAYSRSFWGSASPKSDEDMRAMSIPEIVDFVRAWQAPENDWHTSWLGLSRAVQAAVTERPAAFADAAAMFKISRPAYVDAVLQGFSSALGKNVQFAWGPVLDLCLWVTLQPRGEEPQRSYDGEPQSWESTRITMARLLHAALRADGNPVPRDQRDAVWTVLQRLSTDIDPTPQREAAYGDEIDPPNAAINSVRGETLHAIVQYALWLRRGFEKERPDLLSKGFDVMPEVRNVLDAHLDLDIDPSLAVRSVYGQFLPWLLLVDPTWGRRAAPLIFPASEKVLRFWHAAWQAYIAYNQPYDMVFDAVRDEYRHAIDRLEHSESRRDGHAEHQLGAHLVSFFWRGRIGIERDDLLWGFMEKASPSGRARTIDFIGQVLRDLKDDPSKNLSQSLMALWERRLDLAKQDRASAARQAELKHFGSWLASGKLDRGWAYRQLLELCAMGVSVSYTGALLKRLQTDVADKPREVIKALSFLLLESKSDWQYIVAEQEAMDVVKRVYDGPDADASKKADDLINALGARGYFQYRALRSGQAAAT